MSPPRTPTSYWQFVARPGAADRHARQLGDLRAAGRRRLALVRAAARHRGRHRRQRQLPRRHDLAADPAARDRRPSAGARPISASALFCVVTMLPLALPAAAPAAGVDAAPARHRRACAGRPRRPCRRRRCRRCWCSPASPAASPCRCRRCIWSPIAATSATAPARGARDAVAHAGPGRRQPARLGPHRRPHRRRRHADPRLDPAVPGAAVLPAVRRADLALRRLGAVRPVRRAASCRATR